MNPDVEARAAELRAARVPFVLARVVRAERPTSARPGDEAVVLPDGVIEGFVGGVCAESTVRAQSLSLLDSGDSLLLRILPEEAVGPDAGRSSAGALTVVNPCLSGGALEIFLEPVVPAPTLAVVGESPIAAALAALAPRVGMVVADVGQRGLSAVVVASHGRDEEAALEAALRGGVPYVGLVASPKRGAAVVAGLDLDDTQRAAVHTPAGLDIGARTPPEVALSILAEVVALRPRPSGRPTAPGAAGAAPEVADSPAVATDPVCGMDVVADGAALHLDHNGARYWFCGSGCLRAFGADPSAYLPV
ncbi:MAG TPA: XdhC family protein [Acidimicrobiales bacterium]|nr:XdhC family protein [Acidimicrobiales bacterium]